MLTKQISSFFYFFVFSPSFSLNAKWEWTLSWKNVQISVFTAQKHKFFLVSFSVLIFILWVCRRIVFFCSFVSVHGSVVASQIHCFFGFHHSKFGTWASTCNRARKLIMMSLYLCDFGQFRNKTFVFIVIMSRLSFSLSEFFMYSAIAFVAQLLTSQFVLPGLASISRCFTL